LLGGVYGNAKESYVSSQLPTEEVPVFSLNKLARLSVLHNADVTLTAQILEAAVVQLSLTRANLPRLTMPSCSVDSSQTHPSLFADSRRSEALTENREMPEPVASSRANQQAEKRRMRNRAFAARSNAKRKIRNETLKQDLHDGRAALAQLRKRESELRAENIRLRKLVLI
jgi:hypothetical protein